MKKHVFSLLILLGFTFSSSGFAAIIVSTSNTSQTDDDDPAPGFYTASSTDLINQGTSTLASASYVNPEFSGTGAIIHDGSGETSVNDSQDGVWVPVDTNPFATFMLDTSTNTLGYDITEISVLTSSGDGQGDERGNQHYEVEYTLNGTDWISLHSVEYEPFSNGDNDDNDVYGFALSTITEDTTGVLATGVTGIRFNSLDTNNRWQHYNEIDVIGVATIPEPSSAALLLGGLLLWQAGRRRKVSQTR